MPQEVSEKVSCPACGAYWGNRESEWHQNGCRPAPMLWCEGCGDRVSRVDAIWRDHEGHYHPDCAADIEFNTNLYKPRYIVTLWQTQACFGGMEEGGWYYTHGSLDTKIEVHSEEAARALCEALEIEYPYEGRDGWQVNYWDRENEYDLEQMDERLELVPYFPRRRPYYE